MAHVKEPAKIPRPRELPRYRITLLGENMELRGYLDGTDQLREFAKKVTSYGVVIASLAPSDFQPFEVKS